MARIVRKYGGSSLREPAQIRQVASHIADLSWEGHEVVVVVSAMAVTTDELLAMARELHPSPPEREMDMLLSVGERTSCALLALAIEAQGVPTISYTGSQVGIITDTHHGKARIVDVRPQRLLQALEKGYVVVVAGFQGVSTSKEITTLGRGGSDATAVALAATIQAERCELMKDVDGLLTAAPDCVSDAHVIASLGYEPALRYARAGVGALQSEAARLAMDQRVPLAIGNSESDHIGTIITDQPFGLSEVVGIARRDGYIQVQGMGSVPSRDEWSRLVELRGRWVLWRLATDGEEGPLSALTIVTAGRAVGGLRRAVQEVLEREETHVAGSIEAEAQLWLCIPRQDADRVLRALHKAFIEKGWFEPRKADDLSTLDPATRAES